MEKKITRIEVPATRRRVLNIPELIGEDLQNVTVTVDGRPQHISETDIEGRYAVDFLTIDSGVCVDLLISRMSHEIQEIQGQQNDVLSISIPDVTALRVLPLIGERGFTCYTGSQFGLFLAILLAAGVKTSVLMQAFSTYGLRMFRARFFEKRNRFSGLEDFCRKLLPNVDFMTVKELESEIFVPLVNGSSGKDGMISRNTTPDFPLLSAIKCAVANLMDYVPLRTDSNSAGLVDAFSGPGLIWGYSTFSFSCPDLTLYRYLKNKNLNFITYASYPLLSYKNPKQIKNHKDLAAHYQVDEIGKRIQLDEVTGVMPELVANYNLTLLEPMPVLNYANREQIQFLLNGV